MKDQYRDFYGWELYRMRTPDLQERQLEEMDLPTKLPLMTWRGQVDTLKGAPPDIIIRFLPDVYWKAQRELVDKHLPAGRIEDALKHLDHRARVSFM